MPSFGPERVRQLWRPVILDPTVHEAVVNPPPVVFQGIVGRIPIPSVRERPFLSKGGRRLGRWGWRKYILTGRAFRPIFKNRN